MTQPSTEQSAANKQLIRDYFTTVMAAQDAGAARRLVAPDVVQHGADLPDGVEALVEALQAGFARDEAAGNPAGEPLQPVFLLAEDDLVTICFSMPQPEPDDPATTYPYYSFTTFRVRDGLIVERWPSLNKIAPPRHPRPGTVDPEVAPVSAAPVDLAANKQLVLDFYRCIFDARNAEAVKDFVTEDYLQHAAHLPTGRAGLEGLVRASFPDGPVPTPAENLNPPAVTVADGDMVVVAGLMPQPEPDGSGTYAYYVYDAFRVADGKLVEHWSGVNKAALPRHPGPPPGSTPDS